MKVGVVTDDQKTISAHFGRAQYYLIYEIQNGVVVNKEIRPKSSHHHHEDVVHLQGDVTGQGAENESEHAHHRDAASEAIVHDGMLSNVRDCEALITRGMGYGIYSAIVKSGMKSFVTNVPMADDAVQAYISGSLENHTERLH